MANPESFSSEVVGNLKHYVYRLIDPRNGETFYVGKGQGNRVFSHVRAESTKLGGDADDLDHKMGRIREIRNAGLEVVHVIHRHGMGATTALEVEAALIDAYPGTSNIVGGNGSGGRGVMHATEIKRLYEKECVKFQHDVLLINLARYDEQQPVYEAARYAWKVNKANVEKVKYVLATHNGLVIGVFRVKRWLEANSTNFPNKTPAPGRLGFEGEEAPENIKNLYLWKRIPRERQQKGASNPVRYIRGKPQSQATRES